jgi:hypothetical protein
VKRGGSEGGRRRRKRSMVREAEGSSDAQCLCRQAWWKDGSVMWIDADEAGGREGKQREFGKG